MKPTELQKTVQDLIGLYDSPDGQNHLLRLLKSDDKEQAIMAAKFFCDTRNTVAPIEWLPILEKAELLLAYRGQAPARLVYLNENEKYDFIVPLVSTRWQFARTRISEMAQHFCNWLSNHVDKRMFIDWLLEKVASCILHCVRK